MPEIGKLGQIEVNCNRIKYQHTYYMKLYCVTKLNAQCNAILKFNFDIVKILKCF